jgi:hypothetical protein
VAPAACGSGIVLAITVLDTLDASAILPSSLAKPLGRVGTTAPRRWQRFATLYHDTGLYWNSTCTQEFLHVGTPLSNR